jgi:hypothetical protein
MVGDVVAATTDTTEYYVIDYPLFIACLWVPIIVLFMCAFHWTNKQLNQLKCDIYDQQTKCEAYSQTNINRYNYILSKTEEDNASLREYVLGLEARLARLQSIAPTESTMIRIRDDANANYANLGQRIISIRAQCINALHELDDKYQLKCDDLTTNVSKLNARLDAVIEDCDSTKTALNTRLDGLIADYLYFIQYVKRDETRQTKCDELTATISNLTARFDSHLENYSLTDRYVQEDDVYKQVLIGYRRYNDNARCYEDPIFCPRYTTDFDKYLGNTSVLILDSLAQLPVHKPFIFADYYYNRRNNSQYRPVQCFIDLQSNTIANSGNHYLDDFGRVPGITDDYANDFKKVHEYCEKIGVKCL